MRIITKPRIFFALSIILIIIIITFLIKTASNVTSTSQPNQDSSQPSLLPTDLQSNSPIDDDVVRCPADVRQCTNGTYVGRIAPSCSFAPCVD